MVLTWQDVETLRLEHLVSVVMGVIDGYLVGALAHLTLLVEHEAAAEAVDLVLECARSVTAATLHNVVAAQRLIRPLWKQLVDVLILHAGHAELGYLAVGVIVETTKQIRLVVHCRERCALTRCRLPTRHGQPNDADVVRLTLLHALHESLQTSR